MEHTIKAIMREKGITADQLALKAKVSRSTVFRALRGEDINLNNLKRICEALGITFNQEREKHS